MSEVDVGDVVGGMVEARCVLLPMGRTGRLRCTASAAAVGVVGIGSTKRGRRRRTFTLLPARVDVIVVVVVVFEVSPVGAGTRRVAADNTAPSDGVVEAADG
jgi:hypothetical protein